MSSRMYGACPWNKEKTERMHEFETIVDGRGNEIRRCKKCGTVYVSVESLGTYDEENEEE